MAKRQRQTPEVQFVETAIQTIWGLLRAMFGGGARGMDRTTARDLALHWGGIQDMVKVTATEAMAISEADKLLDAALKALRVPGYSMADRLRASEQRLGRSLANEVWRAHKLRNQIAHEVGIVLAPGQARVAIRAYESALRSMGVPV